MRSSNGLVAPYIHLEIRQILIYNIPVDPEKSAIVSFLQLQHVLKTDLMRVEVGVENDDCVSTL